MSHFESALKQILLLSISTMMIQPCFAQTTIATTASADAGSEPVMTHRMVNVTRARHAKRAKSEQDDSGFVHSFSVPILPAING
jgi:hypothetical protein